MDINPPAVIQPAQPAPYGGVDLLGGGLNELVVRTRKRGGRKSGRSKVRKTRRWESDEDEDSNVYLSDINYIFKGDFEDGDDLLGGGLDALLDVGVTNAAGAPPAAAPPMGGGLLGDIFGLAPATAASVAPKVLWVPVVNGEKGLEISGTFIRKNGQIVMDMTLTNRAMQAMSGFAIQFNKNSFGLIPAAPLQVPTPLTPNQSYDVSLVLSTAGPVQKMDPLNKLQVVMKNNIEVLYFGCVIPMQVFFTEAGHVDHLGYLPKCMEIWFENEIREAEYILSNMTHDTDTVIQKLKENNIFTIGKRNVEGQDMLYQSIVLTNDDWVLGVMRIPPGGSVYAVCVKSMPYDDFDVAAGVYQAYENILRT